MLSYVNCQKAYVYSMSCRPQSLDYTLDLLAQLRLSLGGVAYSFVYEQYREGLLRYLPSERVARGSFLALLFMATSAGTVR